MTKHTHTHTHTHTCTQENPQTSIGAYKLILFIFELLYFTDYVLCDEEVSMMEKEKKNSGR